MLKKIVKTIALSDTSRNGEPGLLGATLSKTNSTKANAIAAVT